MWPRNSARKTTAVVNQSDTSIFSRALQGISLNAGIQRDTARHEHADHVFGVGDGGRPQKLPLRECDTPFFALLDKLDAKGNFVEDFFRLPEKITGAEFQRWHDERVCLLGVVNKIPPWYVQGADFVDSVGLFDDTKKRRALLERCSSDPPEAEEKHRSQLAKEANFGQVVALTRSMRPVKTHTSWIVKPSRSSAFSPLAHEPRSIPLAAIVSLPSWWPSARITIRTCWLRPYELEQRMHDGEFCTKKTPRKDCHFLHVGNRSYSIVVRPNPHS